jgi:hypothetical protein
MSSWRTHARWGAAVWAVVAAVEAIVAYLSIALPPERLSLVFAVSALVSLVVAGLLAWGPSAPVLLAATVWAGLNLVLGLSAMPIGAGFVVSIPFALLLAAAGLESFRAWQGRRTPSPPPS